MKLGDILKTEWRIRKQRGQPIRRPKWIISVWDDEEERLETIIEVYYFEILAEAVMAIPAMLRALDTVNKILQKAR